jgi:thiosulfate/3-mercaptopyruvate sulfurtransferase
MWKSFLFAAALMTATGAEAAGPRDQLLVTPAWLSEHKTEKDVVILHVGTAAGYQAAHIPGAHLVDPNGLTVKSPEGLLTELPPAEELRTQMQALGISDRSHVIVYSENEGIARATRIILTLDSAGFGEHASLLDGGLKGWQSAGLTTTAEAPPATTVVLSPLKMQSRIVTADYVQSHMKAPRTVIIDARASEFYNGEKAGMEGAALGHVAGAHSLPFTSVYDAQGKVKSPEELKALFTQAGVQPGDHVIAYCHIGIQATAVVFAARTLGIDAKLYDGSFQDWTRHAGFPIVNPAAPKPE